MRTLWVQGSPKGQESLSTSAADAFLSSAAPKVIGQVDVFDVWSGRVPAFCRDAATAKFAPLFGEELDSAERVAWDAVVAEIERVRGFDRVVVSSPMWNWSVPWALKAWIDVLVQPLLSFTVDAAGTHVGTLGDGKPLHLILTRSSAYDGRHPELQDFQLPYLEYVFTMLGYRVDALVLEPTTRWTAEERARYRDEALELARARGASVSTSAVAVSPGPTA